MFCVPADVEVTAIQDEKRYTIKVKGVRSMYAAIFQYNYEAQPGNVNGLPKPKPETIFEVRELDSAAVWIRTWKQAMDWANRRR